MPSSPAPFVGGFPSRPPSDQMRSEGLRLQLVIALEEDQKLRVIHLQHHSWWENAALPRKNKEFHLENTRKHGFFWHVLSVLLVVFTQKVDETGMLEAGVPLLKKEEVGWSYLESNSHLVSRTQYVCVYIYIYICMCVSLSICLSVCMLACMHACIYAHLLI